MPHHAETRTPAVRSAAESATTTVQFVSVANRSDPMAESLAPNSSSARTSKATHVTGSRARNHAVAGARDVRQAGAVRELFPRPSPSTAMFCHPPSEPPAEVLPAISIRHDSADRGRSGRLPRVDSACVIRRTRSADDQRSPAIVRIPRARLSPAFKRCEYRSERSARKKGCTCGCGTIDLIPEGAFPDSESASPVPVEGRVLDMGGKDVGGLLLFLRGGMLASLEVYSFGEPLSLPAVDNVSWVLQPR
jgi:hypothetical protein